MRSHAATPASRRRAFARCMYRLVSELPCRAGCVPSLCETRPSAPETCARPPHCRARGCQAAQPRLGAHLRKPRHGASHAQHQHARVPRELCLRCVRPASASTQPALDNSNVKTATVAVVLCGRHARRRCAVGLVVDALSGRGVCPLARWLASRADRVAADCGARRGARKCEPQRVPPPRRISPCTSRYKIVRPPRPRDAPNRARARVHSGAVGHR